MSAAHTPGPWCVFTDDSAGSPHSNIVAVVPRTACVLSLPGRHKNEPDVLLAAASPDMFGALEPFETAEAGINPELPDNTTVEVRVGGVPVYYLALGSLRAAAAARAKATGQ